LSKLTAKAKWIFFPKWVADSTTKIEAISDSEAFMLLASNAFNYEVLGAKGFKAVAYLVHSCNCYKLVYSDFDDVMTALQRLIDEA